MIELARRRMMMGGSTKPYDAEVEWIASDGNTVVDTGILPNQSLGIELDCNVVSNSVATWIFGARQSNGVAQYALLDNKNIETQYRYGSSGVLGPALTGVFKLLKEENSPHLYVIRNGVVTNTYSTNAQTFSTPYTLWLFGIHLSNPQIPSNTSKQLRISSGKLRRGGNIIGDYISVRKDGKGYLYDRVTASLLPNVGESMLFGPDK